MQPAWPLLFFPIFYAAFIHYDDQFDEFPEHDYKFATPGQLRNYKDDLRKCGIGHCFSKKRKSPINIDLANVTSVYLPPLTFKDYSTSENVSESTKSNFTATIHGFSNWTTKPILSGGPLNGEYHLVEVRWDMYDLYYPRGTQPKHHGHSVNKAQYDFELHFVHTKEGLSVEEAQQVQGGVVTVAVFATQIKLSVYDRRFYTDVTSNLPRTPGVQFNWVSPETFLPKDRNAYYTYNGTFAQPPCTGDVTWIILANPTKMTVLDLRAYLATKQTIYRPINNMRFKKKTNTEVLFNDAQIRSVPQFFPVST